MKNRKSAGPDGLQAELLKYSSKAIAPVICNIINRAVNENLDISAVIGAGTLVPLAKPGKPKGPCKSLRPVVLLNTIRKALSLVVLKRIAPDVEKHLGHTQSGFRKGRSTADVVWTQKWLTAKAQRHPWSFHMLGIDMSRAFDTLDREKLMNVMRTITDDDQVRLIALLLANTTLAVKVGKERAEPFSNTIGTPQGDGLSPVLFTCYLEAAIREAKSKLPPRPEEDADMPHDTRYADDVNFYSTSMPWLQTSLPIIAATLEGWSLVVNTQKTEWMSVSADQ